MDKLNTFDDFWEYISNVIGLGFSEIKEKWIKPTVSGLEVEITGWKDVRVVLVGKPRVGIRLCERSTKQDGEKELVVLRKTAISAGGLTTRDWERVMGKSMIWLEKHDLYPKHQRYVISDMVAKVGQMKLF